MLYILNKLDKTSKNKKYKKNNVNNFTKIFLANELNKFILANHKIY